MVNLFRADLQHLGLESDHPLSAAILRCGRKKKKKPSCELALRASSPRAHMTTDLAFHTHARGRRQGTAINLPSGAPPCSKPVAVGGATQARLAERRPGGETETETGLSEEEEGSDRTGSCFKVRQVPNWLFVPGVCVWGAC